MKTRKFECFINENEIVTVICENHFNDLIVKGIQYQDDVFIKLEDLSFNIQEYIIEQVKKMNNI